MSDSQLDYFKAAREFFEDEVRSLLDEIDRLRIRCETYEAAYWVAYQATRQRHNGHWDPTMQHGLGCRECIRAQEAREDCEKIIQEGLQKLVERTTAEGGTT